MIHGKIKVKGLVVPGEKTCRIQNQDIPRAEQFGPAQSGAAGRGGTGQDRMPSGRFAKDTTDPLAPRASKTIVLNAPSEARAKEILCQPMEEQSQRLTT